MYVDYDWSLKFDKWPLKGVKLLQFITWAIKLAKKKTVNRMSLVTKNEGK